MDTETKQLLERIANALDRLAPPPQAFDPNAGDAF
ncbi:MAG TPA: AAA family ATPase, partial [Sneathiellales bacterium]|nr:AAA family ATPase [Sneathiellales bacterium]